VRRGTARRSRRRWRGCRHVDLFKARSRLEQVRTEKRSLEKRCEELEEKLSHERLLLVKLNERLQKLGTPPDQLDKDEVRVLVVLSESEGD
jgi:hypothetical protein